MRVKNDNFRCKVVTKAIVLFVCILRCPAPPSHFHALPLALFPPLSPAHCRRSSFLFFLFFCPTLLLLLLLRIVVPLPVFFCCIPVASRWLVSLLKILLVCLQQQLAALHTKFFTNISCSIFTIIHTMALLNVLFYNFLFIHLYIYLF